MPDILEMLRSEIDRLKSERSNLVAQRSEVVASIDGRIADVDQRLGAAERMLAAYLGAGAEPEISARRTVKHGAEITWADIEAVEVPAVVQGHRLNPNSKRAKIIRATKALLKARGIAHRDQILEFLHQHGILMHEKNPKAYLSVILSYAREIFGTNGTVWYLKEEERTDHPAVENADLESSGK